MRMSMFLVISGLPAACEQHPLSSRGSQVTSEAGIPAAARAAAVERCGAWPGLLAGGLVRRRPQGGSDPREGPSADSDRVEVFGEPTGEGAASTSAAVRTASGSPQEVHQRQGLRGRRVRLVAPRVVLRLGGYPVS